MASVNNKTYTQTCSNQALLWQNYIADKGKQKNVALIIGDKKYNWQELNYFVKVTVTQLINQGVGCDEVVVLISKNSLQLIIIYLAILQIGALPAIIAPASVEQIQKKINILDNKWLWLTEDSNSSELGFELKELVLPNIKKLNFDKNFGVSKSSRANKCSLATCEIKLRFENPASIIFTSGSAGYPKAIVHSIANHIASAKSVIELMEFSEKNSWLLSLPMFHVSGLAIVWRWLCAGGVLVLPKTGGENKTNLLNDLQKTSHASFVPTQLQNLLQEAQTKGISLKSKNILLGGGAIPETLAKNAVEQKINIFIGYGLTEGASTITAGLFESRQKHGGGRVLANRQINIINKQIHIAGETLAIGYFKGGEIIPLTVDDNGWFNTKDVGKLIIGSDGQKYLKVLGRLDNMFISGGENVYCEEIEKEILKISEVDFAMVIPVYDSEFGARPVAIVNVSGDMDMDSTGELIVSKIKNLEKYKRPIVYIKYPQDTFEITSGVKISRAQVSKWFFKNTPFYKEPVI